ncbi:MAG: putative zinc-binding metallopeptidase [Vicinamibacteria bacterium]|jgi:hypothetical protein|nr:putative zinc-binding metallopeptidase [Vicinamibacteria bacterium]
MTLDRPDDLGASPAGPASRALPAEVWESWTDEKLLELRLCALALKIEGSALEPSIALLRRELQASGLGFRPHFWLSDEWFTPDGIPGIAIPFYLAHPRLARLEQSQMLEVEGGTPEWCMRILRHEAGHAIENAYRLRRRRQRIRLFGKSSAPYPDHYEPRRYSKRYVVHLEGRYAQSHPDEDFAETFAVWLTPGSDWRVRYAGWPALHKLEYVDRLMREIGHSPQLVRSRRRPDALPSLRQRLREHYARKRRHYRVDVDDFDQRDLQRVFSSDAAYAGNPSAAAFLARHRQELRRRVRRFTGEYAYTIDQVLADMIDRCRTQKLRLIAAEADAKLDLGVLLAARTLKYRHSGRHRVPL